MIDMTEELLRVRDLGTHLLDMPVVELEAAVWNGFMVAGGIMVALIFLMWLGHRRR